MRSNLFLAGLVCLFMLACKGKKEENKGDKSFISVNSLIRAQVAHVDTGLYTIIKTVSVNDGPNDTIYVSREEFGTAASEFLSLPDLGDKKVARRFKEESAIYDSLINRVIFTYVPLDAAKEDIKKIELVVTPVLGEESKVSSIIINTGHTNRDSSVQKKMLWLSDKSFQVYSTIEKPGQPEKNILTRVTWNEGLRE